MKGMTLLIPAGLALSAPATAHTGPYIGIEGGLLSGRANDVDEIVSSSAMQTAEYDDVLAIGYKRGRDLAIVAGYGFRPFRLELELAHKRAAIAQSIPDDNFDSFIESFNAALSELAASASLGEPPLTLRDLAVEGEMRVASAMANGLVDARVGKSVFLYGGGGIGRSIATALGDRDGALAWQWFAGVRYAIDHKIELGLKYRYFNSGILKLQHAGIRISGQAAETAIHLRPEIEGEFRSRSLLATIHFAL